MRQLVAALALATVLTVTIAPAANARSYRIVTSGGAITRLGPLKRAGDATLGRVISVFGQPSSISGGGPYGTACRVRWRSRKITAMFANFGGYDTCNPAYGRLQKFTVRSRAWRTIGGLHVGNSTDTLQEKYPDATIENGVWSLVSADLGYGTDAITTVGAVPRNGRVAALTMWVGGAGD